MQASISSDGVLVLYTDTPAETFAVKHIQPLLLIKDNCGVSGKAIKMYDLIEKED